MGDDAAPLVGVLVADGRHLGGDDAAQLGVVGQDRFELGDGLEQLGHLLFELGAAQPGQAAERHVEDVGGLDLGEGERARPSSAVRAVGRSSEPRMVAITASSMSMARRRPSTMWARSRALRSRNSERRVTTSIWWSM